MILYPAIDLKDGACVRLLKGDMGQATVFNDDPAAQARLFADAGAEWLHMVDLNGAMEGRAVNAEAVRAVLGAVDIPVQLGGGIRDREDIERWLDLGVARVVLGTLAIKEPHTVTDAAIDFPGRIAVGIDTRGGKVATEGWLTSTEVTALELARVFEDEGVAVFIHTDIDRDGVMAGPNVESTAELAEAVRVPVIASGGVSSLDDLAVLKAKEASGIGGVIVGRALYDGGLDLGEALALVRS